MVKLCLTCNLEKDLEFFQIHHYKDGDPAYRNQCKVCRNKVTSGAFLKRRRASINLRDKDNKRKRLHRKDPAKRARFILEDSKKSDKKKNRQNDLTLEFIKETIANGCVYCGERSINICLDRKDNFKGHLKDNVVAACVRCNYIRNSMPYEAWLNIVSIIRETRLMGLFDNWKTRLW